VGDEPAVSLEGMRNLGPVISTRLRAVGIDTPSALQRVGAVEAYVRLKQAFPVETTHAQLYALHGAVTGVRWYTLSEESRAALRDAAARRQPL
jgi:DNA transformation protein and related proteins